MHHRRRRRKRSHAGRTLLVILCLLLLLVLGAAGAVSGKLARLDRDGFVDVVDENGSIVSIQQGKTATGGIFGVLKGALGIGSKDTVNSLLIGSDMRIPNTDDIGRGDVTMLCSLNKKTGAVKLASFERGTGVPWEGHEWLMLTSFYRFNGPAATTKVLGECFQIDFDAYAHVDFDSFREIIDTIGGVDVELTAGEADKLGLPYGGMNHLNGKQALAFCRLRSIDSNWERTGRQRRTIQAVLTKAKTLSLTDLNDLADSVLSMIDTDLDNETIIGLMMSLGKFAGKTADQLVVPDQEHILPGGMGYNKADFDYEAERIRVFLES